MRGDDSQFLVAVAVLTVVVVALLAVVVFLVLGARRAQTASSHREGDERDARQRLFDEQLADIRADVAAERESLRRREQQIADDEARVRAESATLDGRQQDLDRLRAEVLALQEAEVEATRKADEEMQRIAGLSHEQAQADVVARAEHEARLRSAAAARDIEDDARKNAEQRARRIVVDAIQRIASDQTTESVVTAVQITGDDMKGRIIGREGRNIRAFEQLTGVNLLIDDTPGAVLLSCFDPVRREVARLTLEKLISDGRIHPARIEEVYERTKSEIDDRMVRAAEDALAAVGITDIHPDLLPTIGALAYRTSYGQNVLAHLVESAHLAGLMAAELGLDIAVCKRAAFLHDIGKALTHEHEGSHALVGAELARKYGESPDIVHAIEAHHNEVEPRTVEAVLTQAADAISGGRLGARRDSLENYVKRLDRLEAIASAHPGVERVFAMQAGRELRVMVEPSAIDDAAAAALARDIVAEIEAELTYPGQIRVTVVRESRATEIAH